MALSVPELLDFVVGLNPRGRLGGEEGVLFGDPERDASGVLVAWMPTVAAIRHAAAEGCGILLCHEALTFHDYFPTASGPDPWAADRARLDLLRQSGTTVVRAHSTVDPTHVVPGFIETIGLSAPATSGSVWSFHHEPERAVGEVARGVADALGMAHVRLTGDPARTVTRVGTMVGGLGQDRHIKRWEDYLVPLEVELIIAGETNDFAQRFALDSDICLIETCHSASEEPGLRKLASDLANAFLGCRVVFHEEVVPWLTV